MEYQYRKTDNPEVFERYFPEVSAGFINMNELDAEIIALQAQIGKDILPIKSEYSQVEREAIELKNSETNNRDADLQRILNEKLDEKEKIRIAEAKPLQL